MQRYNILYIEDTMGRGGSVVSLCHLLQYLNRQKYRPFALLYRKNQEDYLKSRCTDVQTVVARPGESLKESAFGKFIVKCMKFFGKQGKRAGYFLVFLIDFITIILPYTFKVYFAVKKWNIHLVHLNTGICMPGILLSKLLRVPCIVTQRGPEWISPVIKLFSRHVTFFMANSKATKKDILEMGVDASKISVVYPPVDLKTFDSNITSFEGRKEFNLSPDDLSIGILGTVVEAKGHKVLFQAMEKVSRVIPDFKLFVIGDSRGTDEYKTELLDFADKLGIKDKVIFTGFRNDVFELIQVLDIVVHASLFPEPFGKVIIEGMAMKKPVIATLGGGTSEIIEDGHNGFLVPPNDPEKLAEKIIELLLDKDLREKIGKAAWQNVKDHFAIEQHINNVESIYDTIL